MDVGLRSTPLSTFLTRLIWLCLLPLVMLATWLSIDNARALRSENEREAQDVANNLAAEIDYFLDARIRALQILTASSHAANTAYRTEFYQAARGFQQHFDGHVVLADTDLQMLFNTRRPIGTDLPRLPQPERGAIIPQVLATGQPAVSDIVPGPVAEQPLVAIVVPVFQNGKTTGLLVATFELNLFQQRLRQASLHEDWSIVLRDSQGRDIARRAPRSASTAAYQGESFHFIVPSQVSRWTVSVDIPHVGLRAVLPSVITHFLLMLGATLLAGWLGGRWAGKRLHAAVMTLTQPPMPGREHSDIAEIITTQQVLDATTALLRESEQRYHSLFEKSHAVMLLIDPETGRIVDANTKAIEYYGWPRETLLSLQISDINTLPADAVRAEMARARAEERNHFDFCHRLASGEIREVEVFSGPIAISGRQMLYSIIHDVSDRKRAERALAERELAFRMLTEQIPAIIYRASINEFSETTYISPHIGELGYTPEEWLAAPNLWLASLHPDDKDPVLDKLAEFHRAGGKLELEYRLRHRDGTWRNYRDIARILHDSEGCPLYLQGVMLDVTTQKQEEMALQDALAAAQHLREALDNVNAYVYIKDRESRYVYANRMMLELFGCSVVELIGSPDERYFPAETVARMRAIDLRVLAGECTSEEIVVAPPGDRRRVYWEVKSPIYVGDNRSEVWGISGISTDITAHKELEDKLSFLHRRSQVMLELPRLGDSLDETAFIQRGLELAEELTASRISFIHFINDDEETIELVTWSRRTLETYCRAAFDRHYPVNQAGIWAEALRQKRPVIFNDYAIAADKRGLPAGHAELERLISVPVIENNKVVMLAGIGNKPEYYVERDSETLQLVANEIWRLVQRNRNHLKIERFNRMIERSLNEIFTFDANTLRFVDANRGACENIGYTLDELRRMTPLDINPQLTPESLARLIESLRTRKERIISLTTTHRRKNGTEYHAELHIEMTDDAHPLFIAVARDITERQRLEQAVRQLAQAVDQSPESIAIADLDANLEYVNAAFLRNTGYSRAEVLGENSRFLQSGKTPAAAYEAMWRALTQGQPWQGELFNKRKDGSELIEWARISPIRQTDGRITHYLAIKEDITMRRHDEQELRRALEVVEASPVVSFRWLAREDWPVDYVSQNVTRWGYRPEDLRAGRPAYGEIIHPNDLSRVIEEMVRNTAAGLASYTQTYRIRTADGHYFWVEDNTRVVRDATGQLIAYEGVVTDIDEKKRYEQELAANLEQQKALNKKLEAAQSQLLQSEKMASIGQLAAGVAHELNNPIGFVNSNLNTLNGYLKDLFAISDAYTEAEVAYGVHSPLLDHAHALKQEKDYDFLRSDIDQLMAESKDGLARVAKIVRDLKDFSRAGDIAMQWANILQGLDSTLNIVWNELKYKCTVTKHYGELPLIWCEPSQLNQVFMNLLVNAGHAMPDKGEITITTGIRGDEIFVAIADTGSGIAPEHLNRIFDPFFTTKPVGKGTGLGLSLAYSIVQKHHGRIDVQSAIGKGTTFTVWLPIKPPEHDNSAVPPAPTLEQP